MRRSKKGWLSVHAELSIRGNMTAQNVQSSVTSDALMSSHEMTLSFWPNF